MATAQIASPVGSLVVSERAGNIIRLTWGEIEIDRRNDGRNDLLDEAACQLKAYFDGALRDFDLPLAPAGTGFQQEVYRVMSEIPYGETLSYGDIAHSLGSVARAVGQACGSNPIPIVIPCHRVLAAGGAIGGFSGAGGATTKRALLAHEGALTMALDL